MGEIVHLTEEAFVEEGPLAQHWGEFYRRREGQLRMAREIARTFEEGGITVVEGGTGVGKSFAYLVPAIYLLAQRREVRVVVATNKINLQHQLLDKDLPTLEKALGVSLPYCLLKGRSNYLSRRRLKAAWDRSSQTLFGEDVEAFRLLAEWAQTTSTGDKAELEDYLQQLHKKGTVSEKQESRVLSLWDEVQSDRYDCLRKRCPSLQECFLYGAKSLAADSRIVVTNHHLLAIDALLEDENDKSELLPAHEYLIVDEAHSLVESITSCLTREVAQKSFQRPVSRLLGRGPGGQGIGLMGELLDSLRTHWAGSKLTELLEDGFAEKLERVGVLAQECFARLERVLAEKAKAGEEKKPERRYNEPLAAHDKPRPRWKENPDFPELPELDAIKTEFERCCDQVEQMDFSAKPTVEDVACRFKAMLCLIVDNVNALKDFADLENCALSRWFLTNKDARNAELGSITCVVAPIDVGASLRRLLEKYKAVVLTSATLTTANDFSYTLREWGFDHEAEKHRCNLTTLSVKSPFDYQRNCLLAIPTDLPDPNRNEKVSNCLDYVEAACDFLREMLDITKGRTLILFTSWETLDCFWRRLEKPLKQARFTPYRQDPRGKKLVLAQQFKEAERAVLFATASFWEGVDIPGEKLSCVVIEKLPFPVPDAPLLKDRIAARGGNEFYHFQLPMMINRLRQGFGRLIRTETDRGAVVVLDTRLAKQSYKELVLKSLPPARLISDSREKVLKELEEFFSAS